MPHQNPGQIPIWAGYTPISRARSLAIDPRLKEYVDEDLARFNRTLYLWMVWRSLRPVTRAALSEVRR